MVTIAHASINEHGTISNGQLGDQTGKEVCTRNWYSKPWNVLIRFIDPNMANKVAECMEMACANNRIGYDQNKRNTLLNKARKYNYNVSKVMDPCATDCSALVSVACMYAGVPESALTLNGNCATTRTLKQSLKATGEVSIYTTAPYLTGTDKLRRGDILLAEGKHVVVVTKVNNNPYMEPITNLKRGSRGNIVKWLQYYLNCYHAGLTIDGDFGPKTEQALIRFQQDHDLIPDGICGPLTRKALVQYL